MMDEKRVYVRVFGPVSGCWMEWVSWCDDIARRLKLPLTHLGVTKAGQSNRKPLGYSAARVSRLDNPDVRIVDVYSAPPEFRQLVFDWRMLILRDTENSSAFFGCEADHCSWEQLILVTQELLRFIQARYGFGDCANRDDGPVFTSIGIGSKPDYSPSGLAGREELRRWGQELRQGRRFEQGFFRDVFRLNILSPLHREQVIGNRTLEELIQSRRIAGRLLPGHGETSIWTLEHSELGAARTALRNAGLLL